MSPYLTFLQIFLNLGCSCWAVVSYAANPSTWEAEASGSLSSSPGWSTELVLGQPRLQKGRLDSKNKETKQKVKQNKTKN